MDFSEQKFPCDQCEKTFETKRSLKMHVVKMHKPKKVLFNEVEQIHYNERTKVNKSKLCGYQFVNSDNHETHMIACHEKIDRKDVKKLKVRFKEIIEERENTENWVRGNNKVDMGDIYYTEIKETKENSERVQAAKATEFTNFDDYIMNLKKWRRMVKTS